MSAQDIPTTALRKRNEACENSSADPQHPLVLVPLHGMSIVDVKGADAKQFLQSKLTIDLKKLAERGAAYGYATDINGRVIFDAHLAQIGDDHYRLWSEPGSSEIIVQALDKYIILEDVALDVQPPIDLWMLVGTTQESLHTALESADLPLRGYTQHSEGALLVLARSIRPAVLLEGHSESLRQKLAARDAVCVPWNRWRAFEVQEGFVRTRIDVIPEQTIPLEAGSDLGVDYNKGCYLGQEVIERLRSRGTPNREYRRVKIDGTLNEQAPPIELVDSDGKNAGTLTSIAAPIDPRAGIAVIRRKHLQQDVVLYAGSPDGAQIAIVGDVR